MKDVEEGVGRENGFIVSSSSGRINRVEFEELLGFIEEISKLKAVDDGCVEGRENPPSTVVAKEKAASSVRVSFNSNFGATIFFHSMLFDVLLGLGDVGKEGRPEAIGRT